MTDRNEQGLCVAPGPHDRSHDFVMEQQIDRTAALRIRLLVATDETRLRHSHRGDSGENADVTGKAETTGMRKALSIDEEKIGALGEESESGEERRSFAERQIAGEIGKCEGRAGQGALQQLEPWITQCRGGAPNQLPVRRVVGVETHDDPDRARTALRKDPVS